jgi:hypothetical protein
VLVASAGVPPDVLIDADRGDPVEPGRIIDQTPLALGEDRVVRRRSGHSQPSGDARDREVIEHDPGKAPGQPATRDLRPRRCRHTRPHPEHL